MFKLDNNLLEELGLGGLPPQEKNTMLKHIYETLEMRVGMKLAEQMSNEQLDEFEGFIEGDANYAAGKLDVIKPGWRESEDYRTHIANAAAKGIPEADATKEYGALKWLETNFPEYKKVVAAELENLKNEVKTAAPQIVAASQQQAAQMQQQPQPMPPSTDQNQQPPYQQAA